MEEPSEASALSEKAAWLHTALGKSPTALIKV